MAKQPNILWIQTDEQRPDSLGCYGSAWAKTPNLDALARRGVVMQHGVCQSPVCTPSRASQLTCQYPQECNVVLNEFAWIDNVYPPGTITFPEVFAQAGYETATLGKWHVPNHPTWQHQILSKQIIEKYAGFSRLGPDYDEQTYHVIRSPKGKTIQGGTYPVFDDNPSRQLTDRAIDYLRRRDESKPFLLRVSHNWPHTPVLPPPPFDRLYRPDEIDIRYFDEKACLSRSAYERKFLGCERRVEAMKSMPRAVYEQIWKDYMGLAAYVDYEVGRLLAAIKALGVEENTIIVYSSDHGRNLGEWGYTAKHNFDSQVWEVPFIWSWPGHIPEGQKRDDLCELIDTGRTLLALAGLEDHTPAHYRGRNLFGGAVKPKQEQAVFGQIGCPNENALPERIMKKREERIVNKRGGFLLSPEPNYFRVMRMAIKTHRHRMDMSWMKDGQRLPLEKADGNLFDLVADPQEKNNLWSDSASQRSIEELTQRLEKWFEGMDKPIGLFGEPV